jgi:flavin reductase
MNMLAETEASLFKKAMRQLASTVAVASTELDGTRYGMTASAFTSVSMEPPGLLVCINQSAAIHAPLQVRRQLWLNVLTEDQEDFCSTFGGKMSGEARFRTGNWMTCDRGLPYLADAQANILCNIENELAFGTHTIFVGTVLRAVSHSDVQPLVYFKGGFANVRARAAARK